MEREQHLRREPLLETPGVDRGNGAASDNFEDLTWLFTCDSRNRGIIRQGFDEAALLWKTVKATAGDILEIGRNQAGSTVLLAAAAPGRAIYSVDIKSKEHPACARFLLRAENKDRVHRIVADSRKPLPGVTFGFLFIDGDHSFEGVLADVVAHWNALRTDHARFGLAVFHDAVPNENFRWRDEGRKLNRFWIRLKNRFRKQKKPEIAPDYETGVLSVCETLIKLGLAVRSAEAGSMLVIRKLADLPQNFTEVARKAQQS
jgi:predicted O-methyltransferase YrrM